MGVLIGKEKNKCLVVDKNVVKLLQIQSLSWRTVMLSEGLYLTHHINVTWHLYWVNQGQNRWGNVTAISLENYSRLVGGGQGKIKGQAHFREMASPAFENTENQTDPEASHQTQT